MTKLVSVSALFVSLGALTLSRGARAEEPYTVSINVPPAKKAARGVVKVHLAPGAGYHVNKEYPTAANVKPPDNVTIEKPAIKLEEAGADFEIAFVSTDAGKKEFTGELKFAVCSASSCDPKRQPIHFTVDVK